MSRPVVLKTVEEQGIRGAIELEIFAINSKEEGMKPSRGMFLVRLVVLTLMVSVSVAVLWALGATGSLTGVVQDPDGAVISDARVQARQVATGQTFEATTDATGTWRLGLLPPGQYEVGFEAQGFNRVTRNGVRVEAAVTRRLDETLKLGALQEQATVSGDAELINTHEATNFRQFNSTELEQVPSATRNFTHLLSAEAGISADLPPVAVNDNGASAPRWAGSARRRTASTSTVSMPRTC